MLLVAFFKLGMLFSVQLIALTCAIILYIYIKKQELGKWYTFIATAITGLAVLAIIAAFIGLICMACCKSTCREQEEKCMFMNKERCHDGMRMRHGCQMNDENCMREGRMDCRRDRDEECDDDNEDNCQEKCKEGSSCNKSGEEDMKIVISKDTIIERKGAKK